MVPPRRRFTRRPGLAKRPTRSGRLALRARTRHARLEIDDVAHPLPIRLPNPVPLNVLSKRLLVSRDLLRPNLVAPHANGAAGMVTTCAVDGRPDPTPDLSFQADASCINSLAFAGDVLMW